MILYIMTYNYNSRRVVAVYSPIRYSRISGRCIVNCLYAYCWVHGLAGSSLSLFGDNSSEQTLFNSMVIFLGIY